ncbi:MAG: response regulator transcription factor [Oscillospiraceae bacterium]|nr:response regulator transcription factor [Oscillospiraceae bacterium]
MRILIVEDEKRLADTLREIVERERYEADAFYDGEEGLESALSGIYDAAILDVMLPYVSGFEIVRRMREAGLRTPVILLTARRETADKVTGLDAGADYYLTKPFETDELLACLRAVLRRPGEVVMEKLDFGDAELNLSTFELSCAGRSIALRKKEFDILRLLMQNAGGVITKETILLKIWGYESAAEDNNVEVYISFLRKKLAFIGSRVAIVTLRNTGYRLEESA